MVIDVNVPWKRTKTPAYLKRRKILPLHGPRKTTVGGSLNEYLQYDNSSDKLAGGNTIFGWSRVKQLTTTAYRLQPIAKVERCNKTIITRPRHYIANHRRDWDVFVQPLTHAYNRQVTKASLNNLIFSRLPLQGPTVSREETEKSIPQNQNHLSNRCE